jgi:hypothetical protein
MARSHDLSVATLVFRVFALALLVASIVLIATAKIYQPFDSSLVAPPNFTFQDVYAYQYLLSAAVIGCAYTMLALVFAAINVTRRKMVRGSEGVFFICADAVSCIYCVSSIDRSISCQSSGFASTSLLSLVRHTHLH